MATKVWVGVAFGYYDRMRDLSDVLIDAQMTEDIVEYVLLVVIVGDDIAIKLRFQLKSHRFNVKNVVANLYGRSHRFGVFLATIFSRFGNEIAKLQHWIWLGSPASAALI